MFSGAVSFNQDLYFDTSSVTNMAGMFFGATNFNGEIFFNTTLVTTMAAMFSGAVSFNQGLKSFNTDNVVDMKDMFRSATTFNQDLNSFNTSSVTNMEGMFFEAANFNGEISKQKQRCFDDCTVHSCTVSNNIDTVFHNASKFNSELSKFTISKNTNIHKSKSEKFPYIHPLSSRFYLSQKSKNSQMHYNIFFIIFFYFGLFIKLHSGDK